MSRDVLLGAADRAEPQVVPMEGAQSRITDGAPTGVIVAQGLQKRFGRAQVLHDLSLRVDAGEIYGLIGPSGSGKSTAIHLMCGHLRPSGGEVRVFGEDPADFSPRVRRRIGYMPQGFILYPDLTVRQNVAAAAGLYEVPEWRNRGRIRSVLDLVELWDARGKSARSLSGGMQRRLALAAALVHDPDLLFADEPTANLDPILRGKLWEHFRAMRAGDKALLLTTQYIDEAEYCDRVGLTYGGEMLAEGRPEDLRRDAFGGDVVDIAVEHPSRDYVDAVGALAGVRSVSASVTAGRDPDTGSDAPLRIIVEDAQRAIPALLDALEAAGAEVRTVGQYRPAFDEVFVRLIERHGGRRPPQVAMRTHSTQQEPDPR